MGNGTITLRRVILRFFSCVTLLSLCSTNGDYSYVRYFGEMDHQRLFMISRIGVWKRLNTYLLFPIASLQ